MNHITFRTLLAGSLSAVAALGLLGSTTAHAAYHDLLRSLKDDSAAAITGAAHPATFENTIEPLERAGLRLARTGSVFWNIASAHTNPEIQSLERELSPRLSAHYTKISSNEALFARIEAVWKNRASTSLSQEQSRTGKIIVHQGAAQQYFFQ